jgi:hypothetical protein
MGFFELETPKNMLEKAKRELARIETDDSIDHVYNFFVTAYHIVDDLDEHLKKEIWNDQLIKHCGDACNKAKHMKLTKERPDVETSKNNKLIEKKFIPRAPWLYLKGGNLEETVRFDPSVERRIVWEDGASREVVSFARAVTTKWEKFFAMHGIG